MPTKHADIARLVRRFGAAEIFGRAVESLEPSELRRLAASSNRDVVCPFKPNRGSCTKKGGVCSLVAFQRMGGEAPSIAGAPVTTCPNRFLEKNKVFQWVGEILLGTRNPHVVSEIPFLKSMERASSHQEDEVGRIDNVVVRVEENGIAWCALEMQAVYFSGARMEDDFVVMRAWAGPGFPFPAKHRRPDYRSSGPKRLMPQLQIKVPTLRRWGKKMAVVVDKAFWESLGEMRRAGDISNADIAWFIVGYEGPENGCYRIERQEVAFTTLENAVEGLTGGTPATLEQFEQAIRQKLGQSGASEDPSRSTTRS